MGNTVAFWSVVSSADYILWLQSHPILVFALFCRSGDGAQGFVPCEAGALAPSYNQPSALRG